MSSRWRSWLRLLRCAAMTLANQFLWQFAQMREAWHESQEINEVRRDECSLMICSGAVLCSAASITHASAASQSASFNAEHF